MENASRALIIAASTLIALMVLASMIFLFREGALLNEHYDRNQIARNLELYNSKFLKYNKDDNSFADMMSLCNLAYDTNIGTEYSPNWVVEIDIQIGNKHYKVPSSAPAGLKFTRNQVIVDGSNVMLLYDIAKKKAIEELRFNNGTPIEKDNADNDTINNAKITETIFMKSKGFNADGSESNTIVEKQEPIFLFTCKSNSTDDEDKIEYNSSGRVCKMNFICVLNPHVEPPDVSGLP